MKITIDRFEGNFAVVETEDKKMYNIPKQLFENATEGDMFDISKCENYRKNNIKKLMDEVWND